MTPRTRSIVNLCTNVLISSGGAALASLSAGDDWPALGRPMVLIGIIVAAAGAIRATFGTDPREESAE